MLSQNHYKPINKQLIEIMISNEEDLNQAIRELQIRTSNTAEDKQQLQKILFEILGYPIVRLAEDHHRANCLGKNDLLQRQHELEKDIREGNIKNHEVCKCCGLFVRNQQLEFCIDFDELKIGMGVVLFFKNYLYCSLVFLFMFLIYSIYAFITNLEAEQLAVSTSTIMCFINGSQDRCGLATIGAGSKLLSPSSAKDVFSKIQSWIGVGFIALWGISNMVKSHFERKLQIEMDTKRISASDFTIMITDFPKIYLESTYLANLDQINKIFKKYSQDENSLYSYEVVKYNIGRPLFDQSEQVKKRKEKMLQSLKQRQQIFRRWIQYRKNHLEFPIHYPQRSIEYDKYVEYYSTEFDVIRLEDVALPEKNTVFITMRSSKAAEEICLRNRPPSFINLWNLCSENTFPIKDVRIQKAPEPQQINWEKIGFPNNRKYLRKALIWILTLVLISISLGISIGIAYIDQNRINQYISIGISLVVTVANILIQFAIMFLTYLENQYITSVEQSNIAFKIGIGQLINSIGVPVVVTILSNNDDTIPDKTWLNAGGLVEDVFFIALFNLAVPIGRLIDPFQIFLRLVRWWKSDPDRRLNMFGQKELNEYFGNYVFDIGYEYAYLIKTAIFTSFFACMQPIIVLFAPIGLMFYYLSDKRNLLRHFQRPTYHYSTINQYVDFILLFCPIAFGFGHLLVNNFINEQYANGTVLANWIMVAVAVSFLILVPLNIFYCCVKKPEFPQWDYFDKKPIIPTDYDRSNPITQSQAIGDFQSYLQQLQSKQQLPDEGQMMMITMSHLKTANKRNSQKMNYESLIRNSSSAPEYNYDLKQYDKYLNDGSKSPPKKLNPLPYNAQERLEGTENHLFNHMTNSYAIDGNESNNNNNDNYYPQLDDYRGIGYGQGR